MNSESEPIAQPDPESVQSRRQVALGWLLFVAAAAVLIRTRPGIAFNIGAFVVTLGVLVFVHEWGHYQFARWGGMKVNRFGIGFPPWVFTHRYKGINYSIGALPVGGMVDIAGLGSEEEMIATSKGEEVPVRPGRRDVPHGQRNFQDATLGWRFWTLFAGPMMNFLFSIIVFIALFSLLGQVDEKRSHSTNLIDRVVPDLPAEAAGVRVGDTLIAINGKFSSSTKSLSQMIQASQGQPLIATFIRNGSRLSKQLVPKQQEDIIDPGLPPKVVWRIGVGFHAVIVMKRVSLVTAVALGFRSAGTFIEQLAALIHRAVTGRATKFDKTSVTGPVKIAQMAGESAHEGWQEFVYFAATLSLNLGFLNLLPLPALDGGRIVFLGYELIFRRPVDPRREGLVHTCGMVLLLAFMLFITFRDVWQPKL